MLRVQLLQPERQERPVLRLQQEQQEQRERQEQQPVLRA